MAFKEDWLLVDDTPTKFLTWGTWVEDLKDEQSLILMVPGNPGVVEFYLQFLTELYNNLKVPIWAVCHAGHEIPPRSKNMKVDKLYDLQQQVDHKAAIIKTYVPKNCNVFIIGHSVGAKVSLELLKLDELEQQIKKCYMLFPTIENIGKTRNGQFIKPFVHYFGTTVIFLSWIFSILPNFVQYYLLNGTFLLAYGGSNDCVVDGGIQLIKPAVLKNVFHLVHDEMEKIKDLDIEALIKYNHKLKFFYGITDGWSPLEYYANLKENVPSIDATIAEENIQHAFTINSSTKMARMISRWIQESFISK